MSSGAESTNRTDRLVAGVQETLDTLAAVGAPPRQLAQLERFFRAGFEGFGPELAQRPASGDERADDFSRPPLHGARAAGAEPLLAFLRAVGALSRAKIDFLRATQLTGPAARDRSARGRELIGVAERFAWRARLPRVVCVAGLAASGKSTFAEALAAAAGRTVLSSDHLRTLRAGTDPDERAVPNSFGDAESRAVYVELARRATDAVARDGGVIVDATFRRTSDADAFAATTPTAAAAEWVVCEAPPGVLLERARARGFAGSSADAGPSVVAAELAGHRRRFVAPAPPLARLGTTRPIPDLLSDLAGVLDARLAAHLTLERAPS